MTTVWGRLRTAPQKQVGGPLDDGRRGGGGLGFSTNNSATRGYSYSIKGGAAPPRPPREFLESQYETAPAVQEPPPRNPSRAYRMSNFRTTSSGYSQVPPLKPNYAANQALKHSHRHENPIEISPPSSPEPDYVAATDRYYGQQDEVSPIDEEIPDMSQLQIGASRNGRANQMNIQQTRESQNRTVHANIPSMRRARRKQSDAALREAHSKDRSAGQQPAHESEQGAPRWDPLTGERTSSSRGRPSQVNPVEYAHGLGITAQDSPPPQKSMAATASSFVDRARRIAKSGGRRQSDTDPAASAFTSSRPGWRGASGRTAIVDPVHDNPVVAPLRIPEKSSKRVVSPTSASGSRPNLSLTVPSRGHTPPVSPPGSETAPGPGPRDTVRRVMPSSQLSPSATETHNRDGQSYPSPPLSGGGLGRDAPSLAAQELAARGSLTTTNTNTTPQSPTSPTPKPPSQDQMSIRRKPPPAHANHQHHESVSSIYSQQSEAAPQPPHNPNPSYVTSNDPWVQPPSRFSVTTYATSAANTPRESLDDFDHNRPPIPTIPPRFTESPQAAGPSIMNRTRPKLDGAADDKDFSAGDEPIIISLKNQFTMSSPYSGNTSQAARDRQAAATGMTGDGALQNANVNRARTTAERPTSSASSINKMLPPAPPETSAGEARDRVGMLNAELQALGNRRININRSIKQMTELMPTDNILNSTEVVHKREMEKRKVEALKQELAEVQRKEYELGLKLHRAYKRLDKDAQWEPTTLWVRRVTGP
ncbi:hypothetical protein QBC46DRAFT_365249 [Diplogelasinospora grovesii]|uniref:Uncharacterized protein n=1 Tax=Diplogelasinospora grovesii TaxID=303347 RepID=A0AAN6S3S5_9PEZI|nr:hypothetical protein QBC46DRAFT_365249 [Diplogelasinospora grovesii]